MEFDELGDTLKELVDILTQIKESMDTQNEIIREYIDDIKYEKTGKY
jgi:hypothetical protein